MIACEPRPNDLCRPEGTHCSRVAEIIFSEGRNLTSYFPETFPLLCIFPSSFRFLSFIISSPSGWVTHPPPALSTGLLVCLSAQAFKRTVSTANHSVLSTQPNTLFIRRKLNTDIKKSISKPRRDVCTHDVDVPADPDRMNSSKKQMNGDV